MPLYAACLWHMVLFFALIRETFAHNPHSSTTSSVIPQRTNTVLLCGQYDIYNTSAGDLSFSSDVWNPDKSGGQCVTVNKNGTTFDATWAWKSDAGSVHSYPHVNFNSPTLPVQLSNISSINIHSQWSMSPGASPSISNDVAGLSNLNTIANVALDIFADADPVKSQSEVQAGYEIMIWIGSFGDPKPLGFSTGAACWNQTLGDVIFKLYMGKNHRGNNVFSWISPLNITDFNEDISPLLQALWRNSLVPQNAFLGLVEFGSEAFHSDKNVTFSISNFGMNLTSDTAPNLTVVTAPKSCTPSAATSVWDSLSFFWAIVGIVFTTMAFVV